MQGLLSGSAWANFHYFYQSDIPGTIRPTFKKLISNGKSVFSLPGDLKKLALYQDILQMNVKPQNMLYDMRTLQQKHNDKNGIPSTTFNEKLDIFGLKSEIVFCTEKGAST